MIVHCIDQDMIQYKCLCDETEEDLDEEELENVFECEVSDSSTESDDAYGNDDESDDATPKKKVQQAEQEEEKDPPKRRKVRKRRRQRVEKRLDVL